MKGKKGGRGVCLLCIDVVSECLFSSILSQLVFCDMSEPVKHAQTNFNIHCISLTHECSIFSTILSMHQTRFCAGVNAHIGICGICFACLSITTVTL